MITIFNRIVKSQVGVSTTKLDDAPLERHSLTTYHSKAKNVEAYQENIRDDSAAAGEPQAPVNLIRQPRKAIKYLAALALNRRPVGRQAEGAELQTSFESVVAGRGLMVCVRGEPGIGKTTVVEEFLDHLAIDGPPCVIARGRCTGRLEGTGAYLPLLEVLESLINGREGNILARLMMQIAPT